MLQYDRNRTKMETPKTDAEIVVAVREAVDRYFAAIDRWESAYRRYYRMPGVEKPSEDMAPEQHEFDACRRELENLLPAARSLCFRFGRADVFAGLTRVTLGHHAPQHRSASAIGRSERSAITSCLIDLSIACREKEAGLPYTPEPPREPQTLLQRILSFFL
jgi:hypothetical protein